MINNIYCDIILFLIIDKFYKNIENNRQKDIEGLKKVLKSPKKKEAKSTQ